jgi:hypothetical protein
MADLLSLRMDSSKSNSQETPDSWTGPLVEEMDTRNQHEKSKRAFGNTRRYRLGCFH